MLSAEVVVFTVLFSGSYPKDLLWILRECRAEGAARMGDWKRGLFGVQLRMLANPVLSKFNVQGPICLHEPHFFCPLVMAFGVLINVLGCVSSTCIPGMFRGNGSVRL